ncbi:MAG TPA: ABC transporter ATP-binding protein [Candidatus Saccharibacteria bacterium]|nr:ABC transporter ATP-binding protein [Candidatus Saccharibacteria bacterium]HRK94110.1 ABC transporter ATP-binding protein [Candidatus Saccharibacteria bacterium]
MSKSPVVIELNGVTKQFGRFKAVADATVAIAKGEVVGFVGANGAGKTTTISMMLGFLGATKGEVRLFGETIRPQTAHRLHGRIGYASGDMELPLNLTGKQYLTFLLHQSNTKESRLAELIQRLSPQLDKKIGKLSRGNRQKIALVAAFVTNPDVLILDEPTSGLDPAMQEAFLALVRDTQANGKTVFMSSHYLQEVMDACSRVILMHNGKIILDKLTDELLTQGGKHITIKSAYRPTKPPKKAEEVETSFEDGLLTMKFVYKTDVAELQSWLAAVKQLKDVEISEYNLEETFKSLYEAEETA